MSCTSLDEAAAIVDRIGSPAIRTMFDTHNAVDESGAARRPGGTAFREDLPRARKRDGRPALRSGRLRFRPRPGYPGPSELRRLDIARGVRFHSGRRETRRRIPTASAARHRRPDNSGTAKESCLERSRRHGRSWFYRLGSRPCPARRRRPTGHRHRQPRSPATKRTWPRLPAASTCARVDIRDASAVRLAMEGAKYRVPSRGHSFRAPVDRRTGTRPPGQHRRHVQRLPGREGCRRQAGGVRRLLVGLRRH